MMPFFKCRACEALEREVERLHRQLQRATDLLAEKQQPGLSSRVAPAMPLPKETAERVDPVTEQRIVAHDVFPGYEPELESDVIQFVED